MFMAVIVTGVVPGDLSAQAKWERSKPEVELDLQIFPSTKVLGLPTSETLRKGDFEFEVSHRFLPPIADGYEALYGFDGPAKMRLAVGYAVFNDLVVTLGRSNIDANTDLGIKYRLNRPGKSALPILAAVQIGAAWSPVETFRLDQEGNLVVRPRDHNRHFQYYGQLIIDFRPVSRLAVGLVPSFLYNRNVWARELENTFTLGTHYQLFLYRQLSVIGEWSFILSDKTNWHNPGAIGLELETGAHIFELFVTNQVRINSAQYIAGTEFPFDSDNLRIGFLVNRIL
jgi:hypothetical protein